MKLQYEVSLIAAISSIVRKALVKNIVSDDEIAMIEKFADATEIQLLVLERLYGQEKY